MQQLEMCVEQIGKPAKQSTLSLFDKYVITEGLHLEKDLNSESLDQIIKASSHEKFGFQIDNKRSVSDNGIQFEEQRNPVGKFRGTRIIK